MQNKISRYTLIGAVSILLMYTLAITGLNWLNGTDETAQLTTTSKPVISRIEQIGTKSDRGNLLGVQPWMEPVDYRNGLTFRQKLETYLQTAKDSGLIIPGKTIVILPEYLGTWLVAAEEANRVYQAKTIQEALTAVVVSHPIDFWKAYQTVPDTIADKTKYAVFAMKSRQMAYDYQLTFDLMAAQFEVTIVAGSILLTNPLVRNGKLITQTGPLYNVSAVFHPNGRLDPQLVKKVYPITDELPFICPTKPADAPVFDTPIGKLGVLVCADSWNSPVYQTLRQKGASLLAVPAYSAGDGAWRKPWQGYSGTPTPADARADIGRLTEGQAWLAHAMAGRATPEAGIKKGLTVFLRGKLWDLGSDGTTIILNDQPRQQTAQPVNGASLTCLWL